MAQFDEAEALRLQQKHGLPPNVIEVWRSRKAIPDRYFDPSFVYRPRVRHKLTPVQSIHQQRLASILRSYKVQRWIIWQLAGLPGKTRHSYCGDFAQGKTSLHPDEQLRLTNEIQQLRVDIKNNLPGDTQTPGLLRGQLTTEQQQKLLKIARDPRLKRPGLVGADLANRLSPSKEKDNLCYTDEEFILLIDGLSIFLLESRL